MTTIRPALLSFTTLLCLTAAPLGAQPEAAISNGVLEAKLYLPDPGEGYYRGTRFDWSGQIASLRYKDHEYFGQWFPKYDPKLHDAIMGPVEEFRTEDGGLGYAEARPGGEFIRIGVGVVRKPEEKEFRWSQTYEIVDPGQWSVRQGENWIEFVHELRGGARYAYRYTKRITLVDGKPEMVIAHRLDNTGSKPIETLQYNHNFFVIDGQPTGPNFVVRFPFELHAEGRLGDKAAVRGNELVFLRELAPKESAFTYLTGFGDTADDYDITIENRRAGAGVHITGDRPLARVVFWSIRTTLCPEPYISLRVPPGGAEEWSIWYRFYETE